MPCHDAALALAAQLPLNITSLRDFDRETLTAVFSLARKFRSTPPAEAAGLFGHKVLATLFFQPSTRTRLSFQAAAARLGAHSIGFDSAASTRAGDLYQESLEDIVANVSLYADVIALRHTGTGASRQAAHAATVPIVSAGDGYNEHPTQAFADLLTLEDELGSLPGKTIGLLGNLNMRVLRSLTFGLCAFPQVQLCWLPEPGHPMPSDIAQVLALQGVHVTIVEDARSLLEHSDAVVTIGVSHPPYDGSISTMASRPTTPSRFRITQELLESLNTPVPVLHPGPIGDELEHTAPSRHLKHLAVARNGMWIRMALLAALFSRS